MKGYRTRWENESLNTNSWTFEVVVNNSPVLCDIAWGDLA